MVELTLEETQNIEGGLIPLLIAGGVALILSGCGKRNEGSNITVYCNDCDVTVDEKTGTVTATPRK